MLLSEVNIKIAVGKSIESGLFFVQMNFIVLKLHQCRCAVNDQRPAMGIVMTSVVAAPDLGQQLFGFWRSGAC